MFESKEEVKKPVVSPEMADQEFERWLEYRMVSDVEKEEHATLISLAIESISKGYLIINEDNTITHKLREPFENESPIYEFIYKNRLNDFDKQRSMKGVNSKDQNESFNALISELCDQPKGVIKKLHTADKRIASAIAVFFA